MSWRFFIGFVVLLLAACGNNQGQQYTPKFGTQAPQQKTLYLFGVFPVHNPTQTLAVYGPLVDYLNEHISNAEFKLEASQNHSRFLQKVYDHHFHFALGNPYQTVQAEQKGYTIFAKMGDNDFRGLILTRKDSPVKTLDDLRGKVISFPSPVALAAAMMPQAYMHDRGLKVNDYKSIYVGSQESSIMNVYLGKVAAGATYPLSWRLFQQDHPNPAAELKVHWATDTLPSNGLIARDDVPLTLLKNVTHLILALHHNEAGKTILARIPITHFEAANHATYQTVVAFRNRFATEVRKVDQ